MSSPPAPRPARGPAERALAWLVTGPIGHLYGFLADLGELLARFGVERVRARARARVASLRRR